MPRLDPDAIVTAIPSRGALLSIVGAFAGLVVGLTAASPGPADRQLIERGRYLVTLGVCIDCRALRDVPGAPDRGRLVGAPEVGFQVPGSGGSYGST
jgi:hypothetical protein